MIAAKNIQENTDLQSETLITIQKNIRGFLTRKNQNSAKLAFLDEFYNIEKREFPLNRNEKFLNISNETYYTDR